MTAHDHVAGPIDNRASAHAHLRTLPYHALTLAGGFWGIHQHDNRTNSLRHGYAMLEQAGNFHNMRLAAGRAQGEYRSTFPFLDSDLYKWLEAAAYELGNGSDAEIERMVGETIELLAAAQRPDGYLNSYYSVVHGDRRWQDLKNGHELYCAGHLFQAAVAHHRMTGRPELLAIARRLADNIDSVFGVHKRRGVCGHPEVETALVELYRETGEKRYLALASYFIDDRGQGTIGIAPAQAAVYQEHTPVRQAETVEGHAVRALYLTAGVTDVYMETGDKGLLDAVQRQWRDMTSRKLYITGGVGSRIQSEAFGEPYELPNDLGYCETCAQIASIQWSWRMLLVTGDARYADLMERTLFNGFLSGRSLDGLRTRYENPLLRRGYRPVFGSHGNERKEWYDCACCPPNIMRLIASLAHYMATTRDDGVQIHQYAPSDLHCAIAVGDVHLHSQTDYPWQDKVLLTVAQTPAATWTLSLRAPAWCTRPTVMVNGKPAAVAVGENGYLRIERRWRDGDVVELRLPMPPRLTVAHPRIDTTIGSVAIERGPLVYCLESPDQPQDINLLDVELAHDTPLEPLWKDDLLDGVVVIKARGYAVDSASWGDALYRPLSAQKSTDRRPVSLVAIPYYAWDNRGLTAMRVWIPLR